MVKPVWNTPNCDINLKEVQAQSKVLFIYPVGVEHIYRWENSIVEKEYRNLSLKRQISVTETEMKRLQPEITSQSLILVIPLISTV
ncbi:hypothetical protein RIR_jg18230.t1 [Rhizophagus irregularis DAOM 181602=DAOM 197198]|nr:hypothetical protein RIR_jg18230.t1 [Rhizophagus irregularis DAOM 181602=DAOM 197198]